MSLIQRISSSITSSVDRAVSRIENHDAIIHAALKDSRQAAARARVRLARVRDDGNGLRSRRDELEAAIVRWTERARAVAKTDESKALECLRRRGECQSQLDKLVASLARHDELEARIAEQVRKIEVRIDEVTEQRNLMRSRQSVAEASRAINDVGGLSFHDVENTFDRWEINLDETGLLVGANATRDPLDDEFLAEENTAALKAELDRLLDGEEGS